VVPAPSCVLGVFMVEASIGAAGRGGTENAGRARRWIGLPVTRERGVCWDRWKATNDFTFSGPRVGHGHATVMLDGGVAGGIQLAGTRHRTAIEATTQKQPQNHVESYSTFVNPDHGFKTRDRSPSPLNSSGQQAPIWPSQEQEQQQSMPTP